MLVIDEGSLLLLDTSFNGLAREKSHRKCVQIHDFCVLQTFISILDRKDGDTRLGSIGFWPVMLNSSPVEVIQPDHGP